MNDVYDNNVRFLPLLKFLDKHKKTITAVIVVTLSISAYFIISSQIDKKNHENAAIIYNDWLIELSIEEPDLEKLDSMLEELLQNYKSTGYTQIALLSKANLDAKNKNFDEALENFTNLINLTDGFNGNKIFNKMARVSAARIEVSNGKFDEALELIQKYSASETNAYIHELTGDILAKKGNIKLAESQYELASAKYSDQASKSIIAMKIAGLENLSE